MIYEDIRIGDRIEIQRRVTQDLIQKFAEFSADFNPVHVEPDFALKAGFDGQTAHGMLIASFTSEIMGMHFPGSDGICLSHEIFFKAPVYCEDQLTIAAKVTHKSESTRIIKLKFAVSNQHQKIVANGNFQARVNLVSRGRSRCEPNASSSLREVLVSRPSWQIQF